MPLKQLLFMMLLALPLTAGAAQKWKCSIPLEKTATAVELNALAKVTRVDAETIALANISRKPSATTLAELEVEKGCLVWAFYFKRAEKPGFTRVMIDAGDGQFLSERFEIRKREAAELAKWR
jgi:hypothetical protein